MADALVSLNQAGPVVNGKFDLLASDSFRPAQVYVLGQDQQYPGDFFQHGMAIALLRTMHEKPFSGFRARSAAVAGKN